MQWTHFHWKIAVHLPVRLKLKRWIHCAMCIFPYTKCLVVALTLAAARRKSIFPWSCTYIYIYMYRWVGLFLFTAEFTQFFLSHSQFEHTMFVMLIDFAILFSLLIEQICSFISVQPNIRFVIFAHLTVHFFLSSSLSSLFQKRWVDLFNFQCVISFQMMKNHFCAWRWSNFWILDAQISYIYFMNKFWLSELKCV